MATHDYVIANGTGAAVRSDLNGALAAIVSQNSSATEPSPSYAYQRWADTTAGVMKMRNGANNAWITLYQLDGEWSTIAFENGTAAAPSIYFKDSGTDTGIYSPGADQVGISTGGTTRITVDGSGNVNIDSNTLYVDAANNRVGFGTSSPGYTLDVNGTIGAGTAGGVAIQLANGTAIRNSAAIANAIYFDTSFGSATHGSFEFRSSNAGTTRMVIDTSGRVGIGTTSPTNALLHVSSSVSAGAIKSEDTNSTGSFVRILGDAGSGNLVNWKTGTVLRFAISDDNYGSFSEKARIDSSGRLLVGTSNGVGTAYLQVQGDTSIGTGIGAIRLARGFNASAFDNPAAPLGRVEFGPIDNVNAATIEAYYDASSSGSSTDFPGRLVFSTTADGAASPTERMRITSLGVLKVSNTGSYLSSASGVHEIRNNTDNNNVLIVSSAASNGTQYGVSIRMANDQNDATRDFLECQGGGVLRAQIRTNGGLANYSANNANLSDRNAKKDISLAADTWNCVKEWEIVNYRYKDQPDDADLNLGVVAQQVAESCPEIITIFQEAKEATEDAPAQEERLGVKEQQMYWMAIKALQEAIARIETLETEVAALKGA